jgi:methanogenic corrinoid protein MtbC1
MERTGETAAPARNVIVPAPRTGGVESLEYFHQRLLEALLAHDADGSSQVLNDSLSLYPMENVIFDIILPVLSDVGEAWSSGRIDVATEHFATNHLRQHLLMWTRTGPPSYHVRPVVLACAPGELHEGSLLILSVLLRRLRWPVIYLGQTMPLQDLAPFVREVDAPILVLVAMTEEPARALADWPRWLPDALRTDRPIVGFGGRIFTEHPELTEATPGVYLGDSLHEGLQRLDQMLHELNPLLR